MTLLVILCGITEQQIIERVEGQEIEDGGQDDLHVGGTCEIEDM